MVPPTFMVSIMISLQCQGRLLCLAEPALMGIINITPDSFYAGSRVNDPHLLLEKAAAMLAEGAALLDLGGMSSRPGAQELSEAEETDRLLPAVEALSKSFPQAILSVDTYRPAVAEAALRAGASLINDIGLKPGPEMPLLAAAYRVPYICMHMRGNPGTMQQLTHYHNVVTEVIDRLSRRAEECRLLGVKDIILDPGLGFAKNGDQNLLLLKSLRCFTSLGFPVMAGISRKATVYRTLGITAAEALNGSTVLHTLALEQGANILRVHDVGPAREAVRLWQAYKKAGSP